MSLAQKAEESRFSLLITDDDSRCLDSLRTTFEPVGYETYLAGCGVEAIEIVRRHVVHGAIIDMDMPDLSGLETIHIITQELGEPVPFVIISGNTSKELMLRALDAHAYSLVPKPLNLLFLRQLVRRMLAKYYGMEP